MPYDIVPAAAAESPLFYSNNELPAEKACVGHLRADFGKGKEFWHTWWSHTDTGKLKSAAFDAELRAVIDGLRADGVLTDYDSMARFCHRYPEAHIAGAGSEVYGFKVNGFDNDYYLRLTVRPGDYQVYCYCYQRDLLEKAMVAQGITQPAKPAPETEKPKIDLAGQDGNIFAIVGRAGRALREAGLPDKATEMYGRVTSSSDYNEALNIISEYVETELSSPKLDTPNRGTER